jgi:hypothetical protein
VENNPDRLPDGERAWVEDRKITGYLLATEHKEGGPKARFFLARGFNLVQWQVMETSLVEQGVANKVVRIVQTEFGVRYTIDCNCPTPDDADDAARAADRIAAGRNPV